MFGLFYVLLLPLSVYSKNINDVTFRNVKFKGYSVFTLKFTKIIVESNSLKENVPQSPFDHLEFVDQFIPVLRKGSVSDIENLDELTMENCKIKDIQPGAFQNLPWLRKLHLKRNDLEEIKAGVFNDLEISSLDLSQNKIKYIEATALDNLPQILNIHLADNRINAWNVRWFYNTPLLTRISMQNNSIQDIPAEAFANLKGDKKYGSVKLTINLIFSYNKINHIDDRAFEGLKRIRNLWLDNNKLTDFSEELLKNVEVQDLRLDNNDIQCFEGDLGQIVKADTTHLDDNPYDCDCLEKLKKWSKENNKNIEVFNSEMNCTIDRIRHKMNALEKRLKEIRDQERETSEDNEIEILENPIK